MLELKRVWDPCKLQKLGLEDTCLISPLDVAIRSDNHVLNSIVLEF